MKLVSAKTRNIVRHFGHCPVRNRLGKCCNTIYLTALWFRELEEPFPLLYCCFFSVWDCFASMPVQLISVACGEFGVGWCSNSNCIHILHCNPAIVFTCCNLSRFWLFSCTCFVHSIWFVIVVVLQHTHF